MRLLLGWRGVRNMRVRIGKGLRYNDLVDGYRQLPKGKYSITPLAAGVAPGKLDTVAYRLDSKKRYAVYRVEARTFDAWKVNGLVTET
jgi:hypothetical protein